MGKSPCLILLYLELYTISTLTIVLSATRWHCVSAHPDVYFAAAIAVKVGSLAVGSDGMVLGNC